MLCFFHVLGLKKKIGSCIFLNMRDSDGLDSRYGSVHYDRSFVHLSQLFDLSEHTQTIHGTGIFPYMKAIKNQPFM